MGHGREGRRVEPLHPKARRDRFNSFYDNVLVFLAYRFTPWTSINLVDYFFVRRGLYFIREMFRPDSIYGRWGWRGQVA